MTNSVSSNQPEKYNIAAFFSGVGGIELGFEQTKMKDLISLVLDLGLLNPALKN